MSSVLSEYPETLPAPMVGAVTPTERRKVGSIGVVKSFRTVQRDRHGTRTYAFTFTKEQAAIFRDWWAEWEQRGGGWFAANWPLPWSRGPNVFRFNNPPEWALIGGGIDGQGYWRVSGSVEIRGRGMLPTVEVIYLTSTLYPIASRDAMGVDAVRARETPIIDDYRDQIGILATISGMDARNIYQDYTVPPEAIEVYPNILSITSSGTQFVAITTRPEAIGINATIISMDSKNLVITYSNYRPEAMQISASITAINSTGT